MEAGVQKQRSMEEQFRYKNLLQEFAQRSAIPLPVYQTESNGSQHLPQFKSTVLVNGVTFRTSSAFPNKKAAEQEVAKLALEGISKSIKNKTDSLIHNDTIFCKSILYEYAIKMNLDRPTYKTSQSEGLLPIFVSSVVFDGKSYLGGGGKNKKEAEQIAARTVIESILGNSDTRSLLIQIIRSKDRLYAAMHKGDISCLKEDQNNVKEQIEDNSRNASADLQAIVPYDRSNASLPIEGESEILCHSPTILPNGSQSALCRSNKKRSRNKKKKECQLKKV
ncbi:double-stranded RNA-binding protein 4-like isoform X1 [Typha latifolia]|uniref:double-stranded RNA-binding protein 4-like isoform X1 n=1 Tax=Typha latifolia TaxID=4733 RepID=UPI003C307EAB